MKLRILYISFLLLSFYANAQEKNIFDIARKGTLQELQNAYKKNPDVINSVDELIYFLPKKAAMVCKIAQIPPEIGIALP